MRIDILMKWEKLLGKKKGVELTDRQTSKRFSHNRSKKEPRNLRNTKRKREREREREKKKKKRKTHQ